MNKFKIGDKVYFPKDGNKVFTIEEDEYTIRYPLRLGANTFTRDGRRHARDITPSIFHATPENHKALEQLYGVEFEKPSVKPTNREIIKAMLARGDKYVCCWVSDHQQEPDHSCVCYLISDYDGDAASFPYLISRGGCWKYATPFNPRTGETITELPE